MKKLLVVCLMFMLVGCDKKDTHTSTTKTKTTTQQASGATKLSKEQVQELINKAEGLLYTKQYSSSFNQKTNEKATVDFEIDSKISFKWDYTYETIIETKKNDTAYVQKLDSKTYGSSTATGTDWYLTHNSGSFDELYTYDPSSFCELINSETKKYDFEKYGYIENNKLYSSQINHKMFDNVSTSTYTDYEDKLQYSSLNGFHKQITTLITNGFDEGFFDAVYENNHLYISLKNNSIFKKNGETGLLKETTTLSNYFVSTASTSAVKNFYPEELLFSIDIAFNEDGSYASFSSSYSFNTTYRNYDSTVMSYVSPGSRPKTLLKEAYGSSVFYSIETETFTYEAQTIGEPSWLNEA